MIAKRAERGKNGEVKTWKPALLRQKGFDPFQLAEREGFEPPRQNLPTSFPSPRLQPLGHLSMSLNHNKSD